MVAAYTIETHDGVPRDDGAIVDRGLGEVNDEAAPFGEIRRLSCFAREATGRVIGGVVGRSWGSCCELQQLWVAGDRRRSGVGVSLLQAFEAAVRDRGCAEIYLETFSFQAPGFYERRGYRVEFARRGYPDGIVKFHMAKQLGGGANAG